MTKLLVQEFLKTHSFKELQEQHGVYASFSKSGHKFSLNYDQLEAKEADPVSQETRGLILAASDGRSFTSQAVEVNGRLNYDHISPGQTRVLAFPMRRFFNYGQGSAANIDWADPDLVILEKMDGTLSIIYHDPFTNKWCMATRSVPEADLLMDNGLFTFRTLFEKAVQDTCKMDFENLTKFLDPHYTYCFELTTPYNRIVVNYPNNGITLLAVRGLMTHQELEFSHPLIADKLGGVVPIVQSYALPTVEKTMEWVASLNPMEHEGVVVRQGENRIKVKNAAYIAYNRVRETLGASERNCMELILAEKDDDVIPFLPEEIVKNLLKLKVGVQIAIKQHDDNYQVALTEASKITPGDKKTFAILVTKNKALWSSPFFSMFDGKSANMKDFIQKNRKDGSWASGFLDKMLDLAKQAQQ